MAVQDTKEAFLAVPWIARIIDRPEIAYRVSNNRMPKDDLEDSLFAETLKTPRTLRSIICAWRRPDNDQDSIDEIMAIYGIGDGLNGFPGVLHGGVTAAIVDESMGMFQTTNAMHAHQVQVKQGKAEGEAPTEHCTAFTGELKIRYLKQVRVPGYLVVVIRLVKREGRKMWFVAEVKQDQSDQQDGEPVICATGESLFIQPRTSKI